MRGKEKTRPFWPVITSRPVYVASSPANNDGASNWKTFIADTSSARTDDRCNFWSSALEARWEKSLNTPDLSFFSPLLSEISHASESQRFEKSAVTVAGRSVGRTRGSPESCWQGRRSWSAQCPDGIAPYLWVTLDQSIYEISKRKSRSRIQFNCLTKKKRVSFQAL